jgi:hypothetical protein
MGADGAYGLLFCDAKRSGTFPPNMPAGLELVCHVSAVSRGRSPGNCFPQLGPLSRLAPHTSGPRDVPRCGALSLLQKPLHYRGIEQVSLLAKTKSVGSAWWR